MTETVIVNQQTRPVLNTMSGKITMHLFLDNYHPCLKSLTKKCRCHFQRFYIWATISTTIFVRKLLHFPVLCVSAFARQVKLSQLSCVLLVPMIIARARPLAKVASRVRQYMWRCLVILYIRGSTWYIEPFLLYQAFQNMAEV